MPARTKRRPALDVAIALARRATICAVYALAAACGDWVTTERAAREIADRVAADYTRRAHLADSALSAPTITTDAPHEWVFDYWSRDEPRRHLRVRVNGRGRTEVE